MFNRRGKKERRALEFECVRYHVKKNKPRFIARLQRRVTAHFDGCVTYRGHTSHGYPIINYRLHGKHITIKAARVFLILQLARPIKLGHDAGHSCEKLDCVRHVFEQPMSDNCATNVREECSF